MGACGIPNELTLYLCECGLFFGGADFLLVIRWPSEGGMSFGDSC